MGMFVLGAAKFVLQALSMAGIMGSTTSYSLAVSEVADNDKTWTLDAASAITVAGAIELDMTYASISQAAMHLELMANYEGWLAGQIAMLPEEERAAFEEEKGEEDDMFTKFFRF